MSELGNVSIVANPIAGRGKGRETAQMLRQSLESAGANVTVIHDPLAQVEPGRLGAADAIIAIGGDGTLRAVAGRCLAGGVRIPPLLPVPMGTANLMGRHLGIDWQASNLAERVVQSIRNGQISMFDAAEANGQLFLLVAGAGLDGQIVHELDRIRNGPINYASYVFPTAMAMTSYRFTPLEVFVDERAIFHSEPAMAFVANVSEYGTGFPVAPDARPDDGMLDVCVIPIGSPVEAVRTFLQAAAGEHVLAEGVVYARGKQIEIRSPRPVPIQVDGDPGGFTPAHISLLPIRVPFIVPG